MANPSCSCTVCSLHIQMRALICRETDKRRGWHSIDYVDQIILRRGAGKQKQGGEKGRGGKGGPQGLHFEVSETIETLLGNLFATNKGMNTVIQHGIKQGQE